jgi:hypothetical protein
VSQAIAFSQRDPRWANELLGNSAWTIGKAGCLLTCVSSMAADWGVATDPARLNSWLRVNGGFVNGSLLSFGALARLGAQVVEYLDCAYTPAPVMRMREALAAGQAVFAATDWSPGGAVQTHWVRVLALDAQDGQVMDPWQLPGQEFVPLATYLAPGWDPARGIFQALLYRRAGARTAAPQPQFSAHQPGLFLRANDEK